MPFKIVRNDITRMKCDAIVNTANQYPQVGDGCDYAVYKAAGWEELLAFRRKIGVVEPGRAFITPGFRLPSNYIIHAVSPLYIDGQSGEEELLRSCYRESLRISAKYGFKSLAFPLISTGSFGYPREEGLRIAIDEINSFLYKDEIMIYLVVFDEESTRLGGRFYPDLESYIDQKYVGIRHREEYYSAAPCAPECSAKPERRLPLFRRRREKQKDDQPQEQKLRESKLQRPEQKEPKQQGSKLQEPGTQDHKTQGYGQQYRESQDDSPLYHVQQKDIQEGGWRAAPVQREASVKPDRSLEMPSMQGSPFEEAQDFWEVHQDALAERMKHMSDTFSEYLLYLIESKGMTNAEVYKRAIVDKKVFSKIKNNPNYHTQKITAMCLCVGARLNMDETRDLLARAGYALSPCDKTDIIFSYFIENHIYDMIELDIQLEEHGLKCLIS